MKYLTLLVLVGCLAFSSARYAVKRHHKPGHEDSDSDQSPEDHKVRRDHDTESELSAGSSEEHCEDLIYPCIDRVSPYLYASKTAEIMTNTTLRIQCENLISIRDCFRDAVESQTCTSQFDEDDKAVLQFLSFMGGIITFVCEDKLDEFEEHEKCFQEADFDQALEQCRIDNFSGSKCSPERFTDCTDRAIDDTPECEDGAESAKQLIDEFIREVLSYIPECKAPGIELLKKLHRKLIKY